MMERCLDESKADEGQRVRWSGDELQATAVIESEIVLKRGKEKADQKMDVVDGMLSITKS